jgi:hypothetical protein
MQLCPPKHTVTKTSRMIAACCEQRMQCVNTSGTRCYGRWFIEMTSCCRGLNNQRVWHFGPMNCGVTTGLVVIVTKTTNGARPYGGVLYVRIAIRFWDWNIYTCARNRSADFTGPTCREITPDRRRYVETFCAECDTKSANRDAE